jgi:tetratricopeptide (TPR) repeat protein
MKSRLLVLPVLTGTLAWGLSIAASASDDKVRAAAKCALTLPSRMEQPDPKPDDPVAEPVAMVLTIKGTVALQRGKAASPRVGAMTLLRDGDKITVKDGEVMYVLLADGQRERLAAKAQATLGPKGAAPAEAAQRLKGPKLSAANLENLLDLAKSSRGALGVLRGEPPAKPLVVTPLYGATVLSNRPTLTWPDTKAEAYLVQLFSGSEGKEQRQLWRAQVKETRLAYPEKEKPLQFGLKYRWRVTPLKGDDASADPIVESKFLVLTKLEIKLLANIKPLEDSKDAADLVLATVSYEAHGVYDEALRLYQRLAELAPDEANFQVALASYYDRAGRKDLADKARARAKKLGAGD